MDATFWATVALFLFIALVVYLGVPGIITRALDDRAARIEKDLEEARRLREEAQQLLAEYQRKRKEAEKEAQDIVAAARREAEQYAREAKKRTEDYVERRTALAEQKIRQAERDAVNEVRSSAVDLAVAAAARLMAGKMDAAATAALFDASLKDVRDKMN